MRSARTQVMVAVALAALLALGLGLAACGGSSDGGGASPAASSGTPVKGGTLTVTYQGEPTELDPAIAWELTSWGIERLTYQTFLTYASTPGEPGTQLVPDLATEVPSAENGGISADGKTYTFHLKKGVKFAPPVNREVTAADFKYSFERMMVEPLAPATFFYEGIVGATEFMDGKAKEITGYKVVDDYTVEITLKEPEGSFLLAMTMPFTSVLPEEWVKQVGKDIKRKPLGTGPYVITDWTNGQSITAERNTNWTGDTSQWVDGMKFLFTSNPSTALLQLERGEVDVLGDGIPAADYNRTKNGPRLEQVHPRRVGDRHVLRVHEREREAVHGRQGASGRQLRDRHGSASRSCSPARPRRSTRSIPAACPAISRTRSSTPTTWRRRSSCSPRPASRTGSR